MFHKIYETKKDTMNYIRVLLLKNIHKA